MPCADCEEEKKKLLEMTGPQPDWTGNALAMLSEAAGVIQPTHPGLALQLTELAADLNRASLLQQVDRSPYPVGATSYLLEAGRKRGRNA